MVLLQTPGTHMSNNRKKIIAGRALIAFSAITLICCSYSKNSPKNTFQEIKQFKLLYSLPTLSADNKLITITDSQYIIYYKDLVLYKFPYTKEYSSNLFDSAGEIIEHKIIRTDTNFHYLIYRKGELSGYAFDSTQDQKGRRVLVDSFLKTRFMVVDRYIFNSNDSLINKTQEPNNAIQETYLRTFKNDKWDCDTNQLFFSDQFKNIDFSLSKKLDSIKGIKLFKIRQISNGNPKNENFFFQQKRELLIELIEIPFDNSKEIVDFWSRHHES
jgi:hypothetical protein